MIISTEGIDPATANGLKKYLITEQFTSFPKDFYFQPNQTYPAQDKDNKTTIIVRIEVSKEELKRIDKQAIAATIRNFLKTKNIEKNVRIVRTVVKFL